MKPLSPVLKGLLQHAPGNAIIASDAQTQFGVFIKLPAQTVPSLTFPLRLRHFFFMAPMPTAPILGWFFEIRRPTQEPFRAVICFNVASRTQHDELGGLKRQDRVVVHFVEEKHFEMIASQSIEPPLHMTQVMKAAVNHATEIRKGQYDWFSAWAEFHTLYPLEVISTWEPPRI